MENLRLEVGREIYEILHRRIRLRMGPVTEQRVADRIIMGKEFSQLKAEGLELDIELHDVMRNEFHG